MKWASIKKYFCPKQPIIFLNTLISFEEISINGPKNEQKAKKAHNGLGSEKTLRAKIFFVIVAAYSTILAEKNEYRIYYIYFLLARHTPAVSWQAPLLPEKFHSIFFSSIVLKTLFLENIDFTKLKYQQRYFCGRFATDAIFKLKTLSGPIRCVCHIEVFWLKFAGGTG